MQCQFNSCHQPVLPGSTKCDFHRNRSECSMPDCSNQVFARKLCVRHGGRPLCSFDGCRANAHRRGFCCRHGAKGSKKHCIEPGCARLAQSKHKCVRHGGGRPCHFEGCTTHARSGGHCSRHAKHKRMTQLSDDGGISDSTSESSSSSSVQHSERPSWTKYSLALLLNSTTDPVACSVESF
ncbi:hypothetical protein SDRG_16846 [Saprolegnia diclina VS20]|uniref:Uncharacterized protein n=1 Tax=Saprolegnia diclina (strain VS20) TaxID=1156394 RepID=T0QZY5_SAPDV|nr:hypothetical protein SDRG_16846 [Saprolegnia diclina VS20]EQC25293.1 hypothetical protein SDRG_16846 [Saprolegnia diclina VS20]|eukprot:XP_008621291.1 hypothetical protein SDRG_16846 [Saprolegnia diclina VS20]